jgi:phosphoglucosamine mutase
MKKYPQLLINIRYPQGADPLASDSVHQAVTQAESELADKGRVLLRKSGTEPLIRVMVEGEDAALVERCAKQIAEQVELSVKP